MPEFSAWAMFAEASWVVQAVLLLLLLASVASWVVIFGKSALLREQQRQALAFEDKFWRGVDLIQFYDAVRQRRRRSVLEEIFCCGCREYVQLARNRQLSADAIAHTVVRSMRVALAREAEHLEVHLPLLATIGSTSPYVGLFGTVWGIINAFHALDPSGGSAMLVLIAPGISEALVATAVGLFAAIPAVIAYNRYTDRVDKLLTRYGNFVDEFTTLLQRQALTETE